MTRRLVLSYVTITVFVLLVLEVPLGVVFARSERRNLTSQVKQDALVLTLLAEDTIEGHGTLSLQSLVDRYQRDIGGRAVIVDKQGNVLADSDPTEPGPNNFSSRPEIAQALKGQVATGWRHSQTLGSDLLFVAVPAASGGNIYGAVRITYPGSVVAGRIRRTWLVLGAVSLIVVAVVFVVSLALARSVSRPLRTVEEAAARLGHGELGTRVPDDEGPREVRLLARAFNDTADRLARLLDAQQAFVADASHQLRTPLAALRLRLENLAAEMPEAASDDVEGAIAEVQRLSRLVEGLLTLARSEHQAPAIEPLDLAEIVEGRRQVWGPLADERGVGLAMRVPPGVRVLVTPGKLEQVFDNLLANAMEVSPVASTVTVEARAEGEAVHVHVLDEGPGMGEEQRARAFDRFWRAPESRRKGGGSGLGLAIVRQLVVSDGGDVTLHRAPTGGLDVAVRLRVAPSVPARASRPDPTGAREPRQRLRDGAT